MKPAHLPTAIPAVAPVDKPPGDDVLLGAGVFVFSSAASAVAFPMLVGVDEAALAVAKVAGAAMIVALVCNISLNSSSLSLHPA